MYDTGEGLLRCLLLPNVPPVTANAVTEKRAAVTIYQRTKEIVHDVMWFSGRVVVSAVGQRRQVRKELEGCIKALTTCTPTKSRCAHIASIGTENTTTCRLIWYQHYEAVARE
jgi:hypothetical protein